MLTDSCNSYDTRVITKMLHTCWCFQHSSLLWMFHIREYTWIWLHTIKTLHVLGRTRIEQQHFGGITPVKLLKEMSCLADNRCQVFDSGASFRLSRWLTKPPPDNPPPDYNPPLLCCHSKEGGGVIIWGRFGQSPTETKWSPTVRLVIHGLTRVKTAACGSPRVRSTS